MVSYWLVFVAYFGETPKVTPKVSSRIMIPIYRLVICVYFFAIHTAFLWHRWVTLWLFNIAMENHHF